MTRKAFTEKVFRRLFRAVGRTWDPAITAREGWWLESTWTWKQEKEFKRWLVVELKRNFGFSPAAAERRAAWIMLDYGWKVSDPQ